MATVNAGDTLSLIFHCSQRINQVIFKSINAIKDAIVKMLFSKLIPQMLYRI
jgi:hypothetical protein